MIASGASILVTGGAGFIGSALIHALNQAGETDIVVSDYLGQDEKFRNLIPLRFADYLDADELLAQVRRDPAWIGRFRQVFHLGACSSTLERDAGYLMRNNYAYSKVLAEAAVAHGVRFVYASSAATYGDGSRGMSDSPDDLHRLRPLNMYGYSKHLFDCHAWREGWLEEIVGLKYFNVFGPNEAHKGPMRSVVAKAYRQILEEGWMGLFRSYREGFADGGQRRDFLYVKDAVAMTLHLANTPSARGLHNIGSGRAATWNELAMAMFAALGRDPDIRYIEMPEDLRAAYQYHTQADITRLRKSGYRAEITPLEEAVADYLRHYLVPGKRLGEDA